MANPWDNDPIVSAAATPAAKKAQPRQYSKREAFDALRQSDAELNKAKSSLTPAQWKKALTTYYADPRIKALRQAAGLPGTFTRKEELASIARAEFKRSSTQPVVVKKGASQDAGMFTRRRQATPEERAQILRTGRIENRTGIEQSSINAYGRALFGIPERVAALFDQAPGTRSYSENLDVKRQVNDMQRSRNVVGNVGGTIGGAVTSGMGANAAVRLAGRGVAALPGGQAIGNFIQRLTQLEAGQRGRNAAKIVAGGAAGGATQAAGEGSDVKTGAITGAIAAPVVVGGLKGLEWATRPVRDFLRASSAKGILQRYTSTTAEELTTLADQFRQRTGTEPTVFELLPEADRSAVRGMIQKMPSASRERAADLVRERVGNIPRELSQRTAQITEPQRRYMARATAIRMAESRGATAPTPEELALAQRASRDPTEMDTVRRDINRNIMGAHDETVAYQSVDDLIPTNPVNQGNGQIGTEISDPEVASMIRGVAGTLRLRPEADGITIANISNITSRLRSIMDRGGNDAIVAERALNHIDDILQQDHPQAAAAMQRMVAANAENWRQIEAMSEGRRSRLREDVPVQTSDAARGVRQSYDTPEGAAGRAAGQRAELMTQFEGTPQQAARQASAIAESPGAQEVLRRNLGGQAAGEITAAAETQAESLSRLAKLRNPQPGENMSMDPGDVAMSLSLLSPTALIRTKSQALLAITRVFQGIPESRARAIVDALFSQEPAAMSNAMRLLNSAGEQGQRALRDIVAAVGIGGQAASGVASIDAGRNTVQQDVPVDAGTSADTAAPANPDAPWEADPIVENGDGQGMPYGRAVIMQLFPDAVVTDDERDPNSGLGRANPDSYHNSTDGAVDVRPIPGMTFDEFIAAIEADGHTILEAIDEVNNPSGHATGPHWHVVIA